MTNDQDNAPWCHTALVPRLFCLDARAVFPLGIWLLHWSKTTFAIALISVLFLLALERIGLPLDACLGYFRVLLVGRLRPATDLWELRKRSLF
jgi:intracellular multiplication protein IcmT